MWKAWARRQLLGYIVAVVVIGAATLVLKVLAGSINHTTVALALLLIVLFVATAWGPRPAILASLLAVVCFNFFFLPPVHTFIIADPENWIALIAFLITAATAGQLSAHAKQQAAAAVAARREVEGLYRELQDTFEQASQAKALQQSEKLKSALLDAVTHDLRTPLTAIKASVTTLLDDQRSRGSQVAPTQLGDEGRQEMLEVIDEETDRLDLFVERMVELARIEAGALQLRRQWNSIDKILEAGVKRAAVKTRSHRIEQRCAPALPEINVDEPALVEVVYILLDNAARYSRPGSLIVLEAKRSGDNEIQFIVEDEGPGVPSDLRRRVFDRFFRVKRDQQSASGMGMGLAIAQGIVEAHGGRIWVEDRVPGTGARFIVALPTELRTHST